MATEKRRPGYRGRIAEPRFSKKLQGPAFVLQSVIERRGPRQLDEVVERRAGAIEQKEQDLSRHVLPRCREPPTIPVQVDARAAGDLSEVLRRPIRGAIGLMAQQRGATPEESVPSETRMAKPLELPERGPTDRGAIQPVMKEVVDRFTVTKRHGRVHLPSGHRREPKGSEGRVVRRKLSQRSAGRLPRGPTAHLAVDQPPRRGHPSQLLSKCTVASKSLRKTSIGHHRQIEAALPQRESFPTVDAYRQYIAETALSGGRGGCPQRPEVSACHDHGPCVTGQRLQRGARRHPQTQHVARLQARQQERPIGPDRACLEIRARDERGGERRLQHDDRRL